MYSVQSKPSRWIGFCVLFKLSVATSAIACDVLLEVTLADALTVSTHGFSGPGYAANTTSLMKQWHWITQPLIPLSRSEPMAPPVWERVNYKSRRRAQLLELTRKHLKHLFLPDFVDSLYIVTHIYDHVRFNFHEQGQHHSYRDCHSNPRH